MKSKFIFVVLLCLAFIAMSFPARAQFGKLKDKVKEKVEKKVKKTAEGVEETTSDTAKAGEESAEKPASDTAKTQPSTPGASEDMSLYTKFDFVPGDKVIFYDDLSGEEIGEFPSRWRLDQGVFEVAKQGSKNYILCTDEGIIRPKITTGSLPPKYTIEMEFYVKGGEAKGHWFFINWYNDQGEEIGNLRIQDNIHTNLRLLEKDLASKDLSTPLSGGTHTMRVMATQSTMKCYIDNERVANVPAVEGFKPVDIGVRMDPWKDEPDNPMLIGTFRYAEGGKTLREQLDESGRIVTHGILFDSGSDKIKGESYQTLREIGQLLTDDPKLRVSIEGHTDNDGTDEYNMTLSQKRAASVRDYLITNYKIAPERLESKGWGESKSIDTNSTPEGKANNRRVELVKL
ncbi:MAG TPA: OmpA family protein [Terriglobales bacterium]|nr:OmpA family protein [Terriglobales bacterium]